MRSPLTILRERFDREGSHERYWENLADELRDDTTPDPEPATDEDVDDALSLIEFGGNMLDELYAKLGEDTDPGPVILGPLHGPPEPPVIPAGAVRSGQNVYEGGRRCGTCGIPSVADDCARCTTGGA